MALTVAAAHAADVTPPSMTFKARPTPANTLTMWVEGAAFWTNKNAPVFFGAPAAYGGVLASFPSTAPIGTGAGFNTQVGWEAAIGADYAFAGTPWHLSFDFRYGAAVAANQALTASSGPSAGNTTALASEGLGEREDHTVADLMFGRDVPALGGQFKFGIRGVDLGANITQNASLSTSSPSGGPVVSSAMLSADERSSFIGVGPRVSLDGHYALANSAWAIEYLGGAAALIGQRSMSITGTASCTSSGAVCTSTSTLFGGTIANGVFSTQVSNYTPVLNLDASVALAYAFNPWSAVSFGFRFDGYWNALKTFNSTGNLVNADRLYYGPFLRLTGHF